jgi:hypothetical protein
MNRLREFLRPSKPIAPADKPVADPKPLKPVVAVDPRENLFAMLFAIPSTTDIDRRPFDIAIRSATKNCLLPETASIVVAYAAEPPYVWSNRGYCANITVIDNTAVSRCMSNSDDDRWIRIVAASPVVEGPRRWRILTEFDAILGGEIAVGISTAPAGCTMLPGGGDWLDLLTPTDFVISTSAVFPVDRNNDDGAELSVGGQSVLTGFTRSESKKSITLIEVDLLRRTMTFSFRSADQVIRVVTTSLPDRKPDTVWRPCVVLYGAVVASILPWN